MVNANLHPHPVDKMNLSWEFMRDHWRLYFAEGIVLVVLGMAAIVVPSIASLAVETFLGALLFVGGIVGLAMSVMGRHAPGFWWSLLSALAAVVAGVLLLGWPMSGVFSLTYILTAFLVVDGVLTILFAADHKRQLSRRWGWLVLNGVLDLVLAVIIVWALPVSALWALGLIIGIDMLFGGFALISIAMAAHEGRLTSAL